MIYNSDETINFEKFNRLSEAEQARHIEHWIPQQRMEYLMQNAITEEECFGPTFELIKEIEEEDKLSQ